MLPPRASCSVYRELYRAVAFHESHQGHQLTEGLDGDLVEQPFGARELVGVTYAIKIGPADGVISHLESPSANPDFSHVSQKKAFHSGIVASPETTYAA